MGVRDFNCFILCKEIEEVKGGMYVLRRCRLTYDKKLGFPLDARDELASVPLSLDELGIALPLDLAGRIWDRPEREWGDLRHVQESFRRYERLLTERCAEANGEEMLRAFEASERNSAILKIYSSSIDLQRRQTFLDNVGGKFESWFGEADIALPEKIQAAVHRLQGAPPPHEQASSIERFQAEFIARGLKKGKTVPRQVLFEIAQTVNPEGVSPIDQFRSGDKSYQLARKAASDLGYKKHPRGHALPENY